LNKKSINISTCHYGSAPYSCFDFKIGIAAQACLLRQLADSAKTGPQ